MNHQLVRKQFLRELAAILDRPLLWLNENKALAWRDNLGRFNVITVVRFLKKPEILTLAYNKIVDFDFREAAQTLNVQSDLIRSPFELMLIRNELLAFIPWLIAVNAAAENESKKEPNFPIPLKRGLARSKREWWSPAARDVFSEWANTHGSQLRPQNSPAQG